MIKPPIVTPLHIKAIIKFLTYSRRPHFAIYYELIAYPGIKATALREIRYGDINKEDCTVFGKKVLPPTMKRLWKFCKVLGLIHNNNQLFDFTRQRAHEIWALCLNKVKLPKGTTVWDYKNGFERFLGIEHPGYFSSEVDGNKKEGVLSDRRA